MEPDRGQTGAQGSSGSQYGDENIREGRTGGQMGTERQTHGEGQGG